MSDQLSTDLASLRINRDESPPPSPWRQRLVVLGALAGLGVAAYSLGLPYLEAKLFKTEVTFTEIVVVSPAEASIDLTATGYVVPQKTSSIASKVPGKIAKVFVEQGARVKVGDVLAELDPRDDEAAIATVQSQAQAAMARARGASATADTRAAELAAAKLTAERERRLVTQGVAPSGGAEDLEAQVESLSRALDAAQAMVKASHAEAAAIQAQVSALKVQKGNLTIVSPIDGTLMNKPPQLGEYIGPQPPGVAINMGGFDIADYSTIVVETDVPEPRLHLVKPGGPAEIVLDAYPQKRFRGRVREISPLVDRSKATVMVKVEFVDAMDGVLPQMSARVSFLRGELDAEAAKQPPVTVLPTAALAERDGSKVVFAVEGDGVRMRAVKVGEPFGSGLVLLEGPPPGTRVIASPPPTMTDGQKVKERTE